MSSLWGPLYYILGLFAVADTFQPAWHVLNCIYILLFLGFKDTSFADFASTSHVFDNMWMLLSKNVHPQPALSRPCGYSSSKFCIFNPRNFPAVDVFPPISFALLFTSQLEPIHYLQKIDIRIFCKEPIDT